MSRFPVAFRPAGVRFLGILFPLGLGFPYGRLTGMPWRRPGPWRGFHVPHAPDTAGVGAPCTPRPAVFPRPTKNPRSPLAALPRPGPIPRFSSHRPRLTITRHQRGFTFVHPSGLPLTRTPRMERAVLRFLPWASHPAIARDARQGGDRPL